jgi:hypothetical protein
MQSVSVRPAQGVGVPVHVGTPEPGPWRMHQLESLHCVFAGQSLATMHLVTQIWAPMHIEYSPYCDWQSLSAWHDTVHCLCAM